LSWKSEANLNIAFGTVEESYSGHANNDVLR
jgi:hypothetical protein